MSNLVVLCVEDEVEVRSALVRDIGPFAPICRIEEAEDAADAREAVSQCLEHMDDLLPFVAVLDGPRLMEAMKQCSQHE
ncbi:MAG: hypothetical protein WBE26_03715 [Phycisphaerae bacterium]